MYVFSHMYSMFSVSHMESILGTLSFLLPHDNVPNTDSVLKLTETPTGLYV
jgi:hypothetical protein